MTQIIKVMELVEEIKKLDTDDRNTILIELLQDERVSAVEVLAAAIYRLEDFKKKAKRDIPKIAEAGMELGESEMRKVTGIGGHSRKKSPEFKLAMVKTLIDAGAYRATKFGDEIADSDFSTIDKDWYNQCWRPQTYKEETSDGK